ncbi:hypothetical protein DL991_24845 [Amycolatopsis sp. WAC 01375]|uniref:hypothetical protein n=1 Tax=unclassified Amycolatopsis TaxID=2618356 RepID=UPI000F7AF1BB|nr:MULTISPECIES: hypothetical protein [unclassified Amycolatopsis]RSM76446.1 hypothetical protein DL991_24845 [Amycolatopsis sp. WAC 01375]RSN33332.1 hypothetical protein DL990_15255 [Amycolatopsis sp. WAC 01416]
MPEPVLISLAAALAARSVAGLYKLVKEKFSEDPEATAALEAAEGAAEDSAEVRALATRLSTAEAEDPDFSERLHREWDKAGGNRAETGGVVNTVSGTVSGKVVQARDVHGNISF